MTNYTELELKIHFIKSTDIITTSGNSDELPDDNRGGKDELPDDEW